MKLIQYLNLARHILSAERVLCGFLRALNNKTACYPTFAGRFLISKAFRS